MKAVVGFDNNGKLKTATPEQANSDSFLKIDKNGYVLENFFTNFHRQYKNPTDFQFFAAPANLVEKTASDLAKMLNIPGNESKREKLEMHENKPKDYVKREEKQGKTATRIDEGKVDWSQLEKMGVSKDFLQNTKNLEPMLNFQKSPDLIPITHSRQSNNCKSLIMNENIFTTPFLLETGFCFITFTISKNFLVF